MKCDWYDIGCRLDVWFITKWNAFAMWFWNWFDVVAIVGILCCFLMSMFGIQTPRKWVGWILAIYVVAKFFQLANKVGVI